MGQAYEDNIWNMRRERECTSCQAKMVARTYWMTGLSGSGKSTIAKGIKDCFSRIILLDGDDLRSTINKNLGFSLQDRTENIRRTAYIAKLLNNQGHNVICAFITPTNIIRNLAKSIIGKDNFRLVYIKCSKEECSKRDPKSLYKNPPKMMTGVNQPFQIPKKPDLILNTEEQEVEVSIRDLATFILKD